MQFDDFFGALEYHVPRSAHQYELIERIAGPMQELLANDALLPDEFIGELIDGSTDGRLYTSRYHGFFVQAFAWHPGAITPVHDHKTWGLMGTYYNQLRITEYRALPTWEQGVFELEQKDRFDAYRGMLAAITTPDDELHRVENPSGDYSFSIHVYGAELWQTDYYDFASRRFYRG